MSDTQTALARVREALAKCRFDDGGFVRYSGSEWYAACDPHTLRAILAHVEAQAAENERLRAALSAALQVVRSERERVAEHRQIPAIRVRVAELDAVIAQADASLGGGNE